MQKAITSDITSRSFPMTVLDIYERVLSNEHNLLPGFRELSFAMAKVFEEYLNDLANATKELDSKDEETV
jgi:hypothetical protein